MFNTDFNPYDAIVELQQIQHLQAENMLKVLGFTILDE